MVTQAWNKKRLTASPRSSYIYLTSSSNETLDHCSAQSYKCLIFMLSWSSAYRMWPCPWTSKSWYLIPHPPSPTPHSPSSHHTNLYSYMATWVWVHTKWLPCICPAMICPSSWSPGCSCSLVVRWDCLASCHGHTEFWQCPLWAYYHSSAPVLGYILPDWRWWPESGWMQYHLWPTPLLHW